MNRVLINLNPSNRSSNLYEEFALCWIIITMPPSTKNRINSLRNTNPYEKRKEDWFLCSEDQCKRSYKVCYYAAGLARMDELKFTTRGNYKRLLVKLWQPWWWGERRKRGVSIGVFGHRNYAAELWKIEWQPMSFSLLFSFIFYLPHVKKLNQFDRRSITLTEWSKFYFLNSSMWQSHFLKV